MTTATVTSTVTSVNDPPVADDDSYTIDEDDTTDFDVLDNDTDIDRRRSDDHLAHERHPWDHDDRGGEGIGYNPDQDENGSDSFTYTIVDDGRRYRHGDGRP